MSTCTSVYFVHVCDVSCLAMPVVHERGSGYYEVRVERLTDERLCVAVVSNVRYM